MAAVMALLAAVTAAAEPPPDAATILAGAAARPGERVAFTEKRSNALLAEPMVFGGYVTVRRDGTLVRVVEQPFQETATINRHEATVSRDGRVRRVDLDRHGRGAAYLMMLYALLGGDAATLQAHFDMSVSGDLAHWALTLTPNERTVSRRLARIVVAGANDTVQSIRMERSNGAWQEMQLERHSP